MRIASIAVLSITAAVASPITVVSPTAMRRHSLGSLSVAALLIPGLVRADTGGAVELGTAVIVIYVFICYLVLCVFSIPLSLLLRGSKLKRIAIGLVVPVIGVGLGALALVWLDRMPWRLDWLELGPYLRYVHYATSDREAVFYVVSSIPVVLLIIWVIVSRARAAALERSRVRYAKFLARERPAAQLRR